MLTFQRGAKTKHGTGQARNSPL